MPTFQNAPTVSPDSTENQIPFVDRRAPSDNPSGIERRQFGNSYANLSPDARELAEAIDNYKMQHRRRYITCDEMLNVLGQLGYSKTQPAAR